MRGHEKCVMIIKIGGGWGRKKSLLEKLERKKSKAYIVVSVHGIGKERQKSPLQLQA